VIGGYTPPGGSRKYFGALLVGYQGPDGLLFAGSVGTGFSEKALGLLYAGLQKIKRPTCPFVNLPDVLVAQIKFTEWTHDNQLRQPVFLGLRTDKEAKDVVRE